MRVNNLTPIAPTAPRAPRSAGMCRIRLVPRDNWRHFGSAAATMALFKEVFFSFFFFKLKKKWYAIKHQMPE